MAGDAHYDDETVELIHALALPLVSAQNYLVGVRVRTRSLAAYSRASEEASAQILYGIDHAIQQLQQAASMMEAARHKSSHRGFSTVTLKTAEELLASCLMTRE